MKGKTVLKHGYLATMLAFLAAGLPTGGQASTDKAWAQLRHDLQAACTDLASTADPAARIDLRLNEYGSESYAVALVTTTTRQGQDMAVCIYDKRSGEAQMTTAFPDASD